MFHNKIFFLFLLFFAKINSENNDITIYATNEVIAGCENGYYLIELNVKFSSKFDGYYSFLLNLENPSELVFKCFIEYKNSSIICIGNLNSNDFDFEYGEYIEFPINFPEVKGIKWDYNSFARNIYGKGWIVEEDCLMKTQDNFTMNDSGLIFNINDIYDDSCIEKDNSLEYNYNFKMKGNFILNNLLENDNDEIEVLQDIWIPISIKARKFKFIRTEDFYFAFCPFSIKLSKSNINNQFIFNCNIPIPEGRLLLQDIKIQSFYDFFHIKTKLHNEAFLDNIYFKINRTKNIQFTPPEETNTDIANVTNNNEITVNYFILGESESNSDKIYCPDKPLFKITDSNTDIRLSYSGLLNYTFTLSGILYFQNKNHSNIASLYNEIVFNLKIIDNLAENEDNQIAEALCIIPKGTIFYKKINIFCNANKISEESMNTNDTDILLNWNLESNRLHRNLIIKWPEENKKIKHMYYYTIKGFSILNQNYGCYNNKFYFYIYIYSLNFEPDIEFEIQMKNPTEPKAICKIYDTSILKCYFPLEKKKLEKHTSIDMKTNYSYSSVDTDGNKVVFTVENFESDYEDLHLKLRDSCGDYFIVGLLKNAGIDYIKVGIIFLCILCFVIMVIICFICYVVYKIKTRNIKGKYIRYVEEGSNGNVVNINNNKENKKRKF